MVGSSFSECFYFGTLQHIMLFLCGMRWASCWAQSAGGAEVCNSSCERIVETQTYNLLNCKENFSHVQVCLKTGIHQNYHFKGENDENPFEGWPIFRPTYTVESCAKSSPSAHHTSSLWLSHSPSALSLQSHPIGCFLGRRAVLTSGLPVTA